MSDETTLLPCPFCGGEAEPFNPFGETDGTWTVLCGECAASVGFEQTEAEAIAAWNARAKRTCRNIAEPDVMNDRSFTCSECGARGPYGEGIYHIGGCEKKEDGSVSFWDAWPV